MLLFVRAAGAQELKLQPTPFTAFLDFHALAESRAEARSFPIWLESFEIEAPKSESGTVEKTIFRLRFRPFAGLLDEMLLRVFFEDTQKPVVSAWNEIGARIVPPRVLGQGFGLPTSETLAITMAGVDYVDVEVPGDGANVRGAFISALQKTQTRSSMDFASVTLLHDPFNNAPAAQTNSDDVFLYGRVKATLEGGALSLPANGANTFEFELATQPQLAVLTFEILNADLAAPPKIGANETELGAASIILPDLADPAYQSSAQPLQTDLTFHYAGWLRCQKAIPGSALHTGANKLSVSSPSRGPVAIRAVEVQLKYDSR